MLCAAGVGIVNSSNGYLADQNLTSFLIFGHVLYEDGTPCNSPIVNITNPDTGGAWCADTVSGFNYYQTVLTLADVNAGDVLRWSVTDGTVFDTTNHTIGLGDLESGGIFGFDMMLQSIAPIITGYAPESQIRDIENAARRFNVTIDRVANVTWLINGSPAQTNASVTDASYTHTNVATGVWNVSARASNANGTDIQEWLWDVTMLPPPVNRSRVLEYSSSNTTEPVLFMVYGWVFYENRSGCTGAVVNITNPNTGMQWTAETRPAHYYYQLMLDVANISAGDVLQINASKDGVLINSTMCNITNAEVSDGAAMVDLNEGSVDLTVSGILPPGGFYAGRNSTIVAVVANNGTACTGEFEAALFVNDGIPTGAVHIPSIGPGGDRSINFNWLPDHEGNYTIVVIADSDGAINETDEGNNNRSTDVYVRFTDIDLVVMDGITLNKTPLDGDIIGVNTTIKNQGNDSAENFTVAFYDNNNAFHTRVMSLGAGDSDTLLAYWYASCGKHAIRVIIDPDGTIWETNKTNNEGSLSVSVNRSRDFNITNVTFALDGMPCNPLELACGMTVTVNATIEAMNLANRDCPVSVKFYRNAHDWYPSRDINETELLFETGNSIQCVAVEWNIKDYGSIGNRTMTVIVDPGDEINELDESNNEAVILIRVKACDFTVTNINATPPDSVKFGEIVELNATIKNLGNAAGSVDVAFMANSTDVPENRDISVSNISVGAGGMGYATVHWNTSKTNLAGDCMITVVVDPDYGIAESNERNNIFCGTEIFVDGTDLNILNETVYGKDEAFNVYGKDDLLFNVTATIENIGAIPADKFVVEFYYNDSLFGRANINGLGVGENCTVDVVWDLSNETIRENYAGTIRIDGCDNPDNNLTNNELPFTASVANPWDLFNVSSYPADPEEDEAVTIFATVKNDGSRSGVASVRFYLDGDLFRENELYVDADSKNSTEVVWNPALLFAGPTNISDIRSIKVSAGRADSDDHEVTTTTNVTVVPADLTVNISLDSDYNMIVTAGNNEDRTVNTTLWIYDVDHTVYTISGGQHIKKGRCTISNPDALNMSTHFFGEIDHTSYKESGYEVYDDDMNPLDDSSDEGWNGYGPTPIDSWSRWGAGGNITIWYGGINKTGQRPGYATIESGALMSSMPVTLIAGETKNFMIKWNVTERNHTLWAQLGGTNDSIDLNFDIDLAINVSMNDTAYDGDQETITADITNLGHGNASSFKVKFSNDTNLFHTEYVPHLDGNVTTIVTAIWTADTWNESKGKATLNHVIGVEIVPCENTDINVSNNHINKIVRVSPTRDFSVTNITFVQDEETEETTIGALIRNFGRTGGTKVSICVNNSTDTTQIYSGTHLVNSECYVSVTWNASMVGDCTINVTADHDNRTLETDESNNSMTLPVYIEAPDLIVESLMIDPIDLIEGDTTKITATVANIGDRDVDNVSVIFCDRGNQIRRGEWNLKKGALNVTITEPDAAYMRVHFKELALVGCTELCIYNDDGVQLTMRGTNAMNMWTKWIPGSSIRICMYDHPYNHAEIDRYEYHRIFNRTTISLGANTSKAIHANRTVYPSGLHEIAVFVDPDDVILELNETNNELMNSIVVQGPDISVDLALNNTNPVDGDIINITAQIKNTGVLPANNFAARIEVDGKCISESVNITLLQNETLNISTTWKATIGPHIIQVIADPDETIFETSEENNADSTDVFVNAPDLNVTNIELNPVDPVDGGETWINATITNQGFQQANDFSADVFYEYGKFEGALSCERYFISGGDPWGERWVNLTWNNKTVDAGCIYVHIEEISGNPMLSVFDGNNTPVTNSTASRWIAVIGNAVNISIYAGVQGHSRNSIALRFYAGNMTRFGGLTLDINESATLGMGQKVSTGSHNIMVFADSGNSMNENNKENNIRKGTAEVRPSRDFLVSYMSVSANGSPINTNNTPLDGDPITVNAIVGNTGFRKGVVDIAIIDEHGWVDANPRYELTSYGYAYVTGYPGADAIRVHFSKLDVSPNNVVEIRDEDGTLLCTISGSASISPWLYSDKIYVYRVMKPTAYGTYKYIACEIDRYQYRKINRTTVKLAANGTAYAPARFNSSAGNHAIYAITDPDDKIGELDESNNEANETIYVKPCRDPAAADIMFSPEMPYPGDAVNITATVVNNGNRTSNFTVDLTALKSEYRPHESPHGSGLTKGFDEVITTYPEADWTGVHFTRISTIDEVGGFRKTFLRVYDGGGNMSTYYYGFEGDDIWECVRGNVSRLTIPKLGKGANIHGCNIDEVAHIITLNRTTVTLRPGETANITGILPNVRIGYRSISYTVTTRVDQDNTAFETDESNNAASKVLTARCPDLTVDDALHFTTDGKAKVGIKNIGTGKADDVEVRFGRDVEFSGRIKSGMLISADVTDIDAADAIRVHFKKLRIVGGDSLCIKKRGGSSDLQKYTRGDYSDSWSNWVDGDYLRIYRDRNVRFEIDRYEYAKDESVGDISGGGTERWEIPWVGYEAPYNLTIDADQGDYIVENNEDNNNATIEMGADIYMRVHTIPDYLMVDRPLNFITQISNEGTLPTPEKFNVTLYDFTHGEMVPLENHTIKKLNPRDYCYAKFEWEPPTSGSYIFIIRADSGDDVVELNEKVNNNELTIYSEVFKDLGYGGSSLETYTDGEVNGSFIFEMGDRVGWRSSDHWYGVLYRGGDTYKARWDIPLPADANIRIARLYMYWGYASGYTQPTEFNVEFNDHLLTQDPKYPDYSDYPIEEGTEAYHNYAYGAYCYDVKDRVTGVDEVTVTTRDLHGAAYVCIAGMSLVIVYESDEGILTRYWINEGADVLGCGGADIGFSSLLPDDCTTEVVFEGMADSDGLSNATLITVVPWGNHGNEKVDEEFYRDTEWAGKRKNGIYFNDKELKDGAYVCDSEVDSVGIDERDIKDDLVKRDNVAEIQDRGDGMMLSANGFLILRYPPDLNVINLTAPASTVVGAHHSINATIRNDGRSDAHDFNVTFHIDGKQMVRIPHLDLPAGENMTLHLYNWTPMLLMHSYNLTAAADVLSGEDWTEIETENNAMTKHVTIEEGGFGNQTGPRGTGGGSNPTGGEYTEKITGRVMKGIKEFLSVGGGGDAGMFSLTEWIMKGAVWLVLLLFVCTGYRMEQRSYRGASAGYAEGL